MNSNQLVDIYTRTNNNTKNMPSSKLTIAKRLQAFARKGNAGLKKSFAESPAFIYKAECLENCCLFGCF